MALVHHRLRKAVDKMAENVIAGELDVEHFLGAVDFLIRSVGASGISLLWAFADVLYQWGVVSAVEYPLFVFEKDARAFVHQ